MDNATWGAKMNTFLMILLFVAPLLMFALVRMGVRLIIPLLICVIAAAVGIALFVWGMDAAPVVTDTETVLLPSAVYGLLIVISAGFGGLLLGVVVLARWLSGEYKSVKEGHDT
jgi:uncharacterized membrane-anchored protein YitT (DUF2179 family)